MLQSSTSIQCIFCMGHYVHISHIDDQTIGSVWTTFQLNASAKARLASPADEKSLGEKSCKVTDQRGPPLVRVSPQMNEEWSFFQMNVKLISPKYKRFPPPSSILSPESDGWIFHVPRDRPTGRGGCSCQVLADPGRPELAHDRHQVDNLVHLRHHHACLFPGFVWPVEGGTAAQLTSRSQSSSRTSTTTRPSSKAQVYPLP